MVWAGLTLSKVKWFANRTYTHCVMPVSGRQVALGLASSRELRCFTLIPSSLRAGIKAREEW